MGDQELWDAAVTGDAEAFGELFGRHHDAVYNYCFRRVASWSVAEDLVSAVFLEAWRTRRRLVLDTGSLLPWLIGVATRVTHRHRRSGTRYDALLRRIPAGPPEPELAETVAAKIDDERRMADVLAAIAGLPKRERDVIAVCVFGELDYASAAIALGVPVGTVRSRLSRARRRLAALVPPVPLSSNR
ncbi:sigma-70 family RNA polymerase sigma factor [Saccharothrix violaceirubra]|uniref:RNA polymerase sigma-70 factor (ECF subfamily) n=1 Tax=Saccharothrix violaceirubra TaxID=413306 RepID=A0A7W7T3T6_9PSEU|nr:RNA polymerase sigma factor [Saccharothrix violaceirubra]MBB4966043.1 RNA polymerase sigma-70 factor (ECF subfamily) [Saccharothrix violaceirubra]